MLESWMERPKRTFIKILAPAKEAGIASLRIGPEMWNYLPTVERTIKIPPSMMLQPWMGSDFTNDDLVKESSMTEDYTHRVIGADTSAGPAYVVEAIPKPDAAVVWGTPRIARRYAAVATSYEITPLLKLAAYGVLNVDDRSGFLWPRLEHSLASNLDCGAGLQRFIGGPATEYGRLSNLIHLETRWFF